MMPFFTINYIITSADDCKARLDALSLHIPDGLLQLNIFDRVCTEDTIRAGKAAILAVGNASQYRACPDMTFGAVCNIACEVSTGDFITFCKSVDFIEIKHLLDVKKEIDNSKDIHIFCIKPYKLDDRGHKVHYLPEEPKICKETSNFLNLCISSYFWGKPHLNKVVFREDIDLEWDFDYIIRQIAIEKKYKVLDVEFETKWVFENDFYNYPDQYYPEWYGQTLRNVYEPLLKNYEKSPFVQMAVCYLVELRFACNRNNRNKNVLEGSAVDSFVNDCSDILGYLDDRYLVKYNIAQRKLFPKYMVLVMLRIKYRNAKLMPDVCTEPKGLFGCFKKHIFERSANIECHIQAINIHDKQMLIDYEVTNTYILPRKDAYLFVKIGNTTVEGAAHRVYSLDKYFGKTMKNGMTGTVVIPLDQIFDGASASFQLRYKECVIKLPLRFTKTASRLVEYLPLRWKFGKYTLHYDASATELRFTRNGFLARCSDECRVYAAFVKGGPFARALKAVGLRLAYWATKPFMKKEIWMTFDQLFKGGDNGEYFFRYVSEHPVENTAIYYVINKGSADSVKLKKQYRHVVDYNSFKCRLLALHCDYVFATRVDVKQYLGFSNVTEPYFRDLLNYYTAPH